MGALGRIGSDKLRSTRDEDTGLVASLIIGS